MILFFSWQNNLIQFEREDEGNRIKSQFGLEAGINKRMLFMFSASVENWLFTAYGKTIFYFLGMYFLNTIHCLVCGLCKKGLLSTVKLTNRWIDLLIKWKFGLCLLLDFCCTNKRFILVIYCPQAIQLASLIPKKKTTWSELSVMC